MLESELGSVKGGLDGRGEAVDDGGDAGLEVRTSELGAEIEVVNEAFDLWEETGSIQSCEEGGRNAPSRSRRCWR